MGSRRWASECSKFCEKGKKLPKFGIRHFSLELIPEYASDWETSLSTKSHDKQNDISERLFALHLFLQNIWIKSLWQRINRIILLTPTSQFYKNVISFHNINSNQARNPVKSFKWDSRALCEQRDQLPINLKLKDFALNSRFM